MTATARSIMESPGVKAMFDEIFEARARAKNEGMRLLTTAEGPDNVRGRRHCLEIYTGTTTDLALHVVYESRPALVPGRAGAMRRTKIDVPIGVWIWQREQGERTCPTE